jgi:hypothetical protein
MHGCCPHCGASPEGRRTHCWQCGRFLDPPSHEVGLIALGIPFVILLGALARMWSNSAIVTILFGLIAALRTFAHFCQEREEDVWKSGCRAALRFLETFGMLLIASLMALAAFPFALILAFPLLALAAGEEPGLTGGCWIGLGLSLLVFVSIFRRLATGRGSITGPNFDASQPKRTNSTATL